MTKKQVLLIRLSALGDIIFNLPLADILKKNGYNVTWIVSEKGFDIINNNPAVDEAILAPVEKWKKQSFIKNFKEYLQIIKYLRSKKFDIAIDTQLLFKSFIWTAFCGAKRRIVSTSAREFAILGGNEFIGRLRINYNQHAIKSYLKFAKHLKLDTSEINVSLPEANEEIIAKVDTLMADLDKTKPIIAIAPATTWTTKHWNKDNWHELIKKINSTVEFVADDRSFAKLSDGTFVNDAVLQSYPKLNENSSVNGVAIPSFDRKKKVWGWMLYKVDSITSCE